MVALRLRYPHDGLDRYMFKGFICAETGQEVAPFGQVSSGINSPPWDAAAVAARMTGTPTGCTLLDGVCKVKGRGNGGSETLVMPSQRPDRHG